MCIDFRSFLFYLFPSPTSGDPFGSERNALDDTFGALLRQPPMLYTTAARIVFLFF